MIDHVEQNQNGHRPFDISACSEYLHALEKDPLHPPANLPDFGEMNEIIEDILEFIKEKDATEHAIKSAINNYKKTIPAFAALFEKQNGQKARAETSKNESIVPPLPEGVKLSPELSQDACRWINEYVSFSKKWSPRSFANFHEACGWAMLSGIAHRRVVLHLGSPRYTPLLIASIADSSVWVKTEAAKIYLSVLWKANLKWMLAADSMTPQAMIGDMAMEKLQIPENYNELEEKEQKRIEREIAYKGQRTWFYEEFGQQMDAMMQKNGGPMSEFKDLIRRMDDCYPEYTRLTVSHKKQTVEFPYLSLLACMTILDLKPYARSDSPLWKNGFLARFALIVPDEKNRNRDRFPNGTMEEAIPNSLIDPLKEWHRNLGDRKVLIQKDKNDNEKKKEATYTVSYGEFPQQACTLGRGVVDAFYRYNNALLDIIEQGLPAQFAGNYGRFHMMALRVAMLCASIENNGHIEMRHWAKGQEFAEKARSGLHALWERLNENGYAQEQLRMDDEIIQYLANSDTWLTSRLMRKNKFKDIPAEVFDPKLDSLVASGDLVKKLDGKTKYYTVPGQEKRPFPKHGTTEAAQ